MSEQTNNLIEETSPYLLQHAHNPVHWKAWQPDVLKKAQEENKLILISIGYSACHWCHVMAHECFEDEKTAGLMNQNFINIKVDREERPDVDQVYMNALQLMTGRGGWPLNIVALPDGRPVWGGTYFPKEEWMASLRQLADLYQKNPEKMQDYAEKLSQGMQEMELLVKKEENTLDPKLLENSLVNWEKSFDHENGGTKGAPKFMMPNNYHFLLRYAFQSKDNNLMDFVEKTLEKISFGGVFDHLGGGFARYSTDAKWHVPHFEKMLYDNAQLVSLYCDAFLVTKNPWYKKVVFKTLSFVERELTSDETAFYSALDADSLNENDPESSKEEGAYYVWEKEMLQHILQEDFPVFSTYYNVNKYGFWENGKYVLIRKDKTSSIAKKFSLSEKELEQKIEDCNEKLLKIREKRSSPGLDDKTLTSWNALMCKAYSDAFRVFGEKKQLKSALKNAEFLLKMQMKPDGSLFHSYKKSSANKQGSGKSTINGYLEDYAFTIDACIALYENTFDEKWLKTATNLTETAFQNFFDAKKSMFFFTSKQDSGLIARTTEFQDNVMPSSNSVMAKNLFKLSHYFGRSDYRKTAEQMLKNMQPHMENYPSAYSNWLDLLLDFTDDFFEVAIVGKQAKEKAQTLNRHYIPNKLVAGSRGENELPLLKDRYEENETLIYICQNNSCKKPEKNLDFAVKSMMK